MKKKLYIAFALMLLASLAALPAMAKQTTSPFEANFTGVFEITGDAGKSVVFILEESGAGSEQTLGAFTYTTSLMNSVARRPPGCGPGSSTSVNGKAVLTFGDGEIWLKLTSGTACFLFPIVTVEDSWVITSGTGNYVGATGKLSRTLDGNVISGIAVGDFDGTIKLVD